MNTTFCVCPKALCHRRTVTSCGPPRLPGFLDIFLSARSKSFSKSSTYLSFLTGLRKRGSTVLLRCLLLSGFYRSKCPKLTIHTCESLNIHHTINMKSVSTTRTSSIKHIFREIFGRLKKSPKNNSSLEDTSSDDHTFTNTLPTMNNLADGSKQKTKALYSTLTPKSETIRLLRFLPPETGESPIIGFRFIECDLASPPTFFALSYTWGPVEPTLPILVDGTVLHVRQNLWDAISALYEMQIESLKYYWIDAICINHNDALERTHQVDLMKKIFSLAIGVAIWLRTPNETASKENGAAMQYLCHREEPSHPSYHRLISNPRLGESLLDCGLSKKFVLRAKCFC